MKKSEILTKAKEFLSKNWDDNYSRNDANTYICLALDDASAYYYWCGSLHEKYIGLHIGQLKVWINDLLGKKSSLEDWLLSAHGIAVSNSKRDYNKVQKLRHRWIDWMITYWQLEEIEEALIKNQQDQRDIELFSANSDSSCPCAQAE